MVCFFFPKQVHDPFSVFRFYSLLQANRTPEKTFDTLTPLQRRSVTSEGSMIPNRDQSAVHTMPEEFENVALFLRLGLHYTLILSVSRTLFKPKEFENGSFAFSWTENILKTELFENDDVTIIT